MTLKTPEDAESQLTFEIDDRLNLKPFCQELEKFLQIEHDYVDGSLVIALDAPFGHGKTTFIKMWESSLRERCKENAESNATMTPVVLNAWESDYCKEPLVPILAELINAADQISGVSKNLSLALKESAKDVAWFCTGIGNEVVAKFTGLNILKAGKFAEDKRDERSVTTPNFVDAYTQRVDAMTELKKNLRAVFGSNEPKVIVFVDELDRCRPDYAVSYLETIKHVFDINGMAFLLGVHSDQLASSVRQLYGADLDFNEYLRKFVHRKISLPKLTESDHSKLAIDYTKRYLQVEGKRISGLDLTNRIRNITEIAAGLNLTPRQIQEAFRIVGHTAEFPDPDQAGKLHWCIGAATILLAFLRVGKPALYEKLRDGKVSDTEMNSELRAFCEKSGSASWWFSVYLTGIGRDETEMADFEKSEYRPFDQFLQGWGFGDFKFSNVIQKIETASSFG
jgi:hypothetical protein